MKITTNEGSILIYSDEDILLGSIPFGAQTVALSMKGVRLSLVHSNITYNVPENATINGQSFNDATELAEKLSSFKKGGGNGSSGVASVTGNLVSGTPENPVINHPIGNDRDVVTYDSNGNLIADRLGWKQLSDMPSPPSFLNGVVAGTAFKEDGKALFAFIELSTDGTAKPVTIPMYTAEGTININDGVEDSEAVSMQQLRAVMENFSTITAGLNDLITDLEGRIEALEGA